MTAIPSTMRASVLALGPLLARFGRAQEVHQSLAHLRMGRALADRDRLRRRRALDPLDRRPLDVLERRDVTAIRDHDVERIKKLYAEIIDYCNDARAVARGGEKARLFSVAITDAQAAQMWAVKAITWKD